MVGRFDCLLVRLLARSIVSSVSVRFVCASCFSTSPRLRLIGMYGPMIVTGYYHGEETAVDNPSTTNQP